MPKRVFFQNEENPYDTIPSVPKTEYRDEIKPIETPTIIPTNDIIHNFDEPSRRLDVGLTGTIKIGIDENSAGLNRAQIAADTVIWAGATQENRATAPFRVDAEGNAVIQSISVSLGGVTIDNGITVTIADTVNKVGVTVNQNDITNNPVGLLINNTGTASPLTIAQTATVSTNFKKGEVLNGVTVWTSNGTTPNGNLSGTAGDICLGADGGQIYYCTGTTNWTTTLHKNGTASYNLSTASGTQTIAHGLGVIPKKVRITAGNVNAATVNIKSFGVYNGTTQTCIYDSEAGAVPTTTTSFTVSGYYNSTKYQTAVVTVDATNITLTWTKTSTPTGLLSIMWEAES